MTFSEENAIHEGVKEGKWIVSSSAPMTKFACSSEN
jgi:hypothetical protein